MKKISKCVLAAASLVSLTFSSAHAYVGNRPGALTVTLGGGYFYLDSMRDMDNKAAGMVEIGYDFTQHWGIEGLLAGFRTHFEPSVQNHESISGTFFSIDGVYHFFPEYRFQPYVLAGVGILGLSPNLYDANNSGDINAAVGAQFFISPLFSVRFEARDMYTWVGGRNDIFINAGLGFSFDLC